MAPLIAHDRSQPSEQEAHRVLAHVRGLIKNQQVMRSALILLLVAGIGERAKLDLTPDAIGPCGAPDVVLAIVSLAPAQQLGEAIDHAGQLGAVKPEHTNLAVLRQGFAAGQIGLATTGGTTIADDVGAAAVGHALWPLERSPDGLVADQ